MMRLRHGTVTILLAVGLLCPATPGCNRVVADEPDRSPLVITPPIEEQWGQKAYKDFRKDHPESDDVDLAKRVSRVGRQVAAVSDRPTHPFRFIVIEGSDLQAYSFPGRTVCLTEGLARLLSSDHQLAYALGHELSHIALRHHIYQLRMQEAIELGGDARKAMLETVKGLFDQDSEIEADRYGALYAVRAGYAFSESVIALQRIGHSTHGGQQSSRHPSFARRIEHIKKFEKELRLALAAFQKGNKAQVEGEYEEAIDQYYLFLAEFPNSVKGLINLGGAHLNLVHVQAGSPQGLAVVLLPILHDPGIHLRSILNYQLLDDAELCFDQALKIRPDEALAEAGLGLIDTRRNHLETARYHLEQAREAEPFNPDFILNLGNVEYIAGNYAAAVRYYEEALDKMPAWPEAEKNLRMARRKLI